jgi:undecaprenyl-diphosphatase
MSDLLTVVLLGIVEGLTEFIPVSSTGHLVLAGALLGFKDGSGGAFDIVIQLGAILAVIALYWRRFLDVAIGLFGWKQGPPAISFWVSCPRPQSVRWPTRRSRPCSKPQQSSPGR